MFSRAAEAAAWMPGEISPDAGRALLVQRQSCLFSLAAFVFLYGDSDY